MDITKTIRLRPGHYVVAVSGGVDSMVLLDMLTRLYGDKTSGVKMTVAHFDHGIRDVSHLDRMLVHEVAQKHGLPFVYHEGNLGTGASEAAAREARYKFLRSVQKHSGAHSIITAHHMDDAIETAILNIIRGTGRKGMSSLHKAKDGLVRPLLHVPKSHLRAYAEANGLTWHEDSTNTNQDYKRNYVRHSIVPKAKAASPQDYHKLVALLRRQRELNHAIDAYLDTILHTQPSKSKLRRRDVTALPYRVATELVAEWLRQNGKRQLSKWLVGRLTVAIRTAHPKTELLLDSHSKVSFSKTGAEFIKV
jgi:tRNA(Ile)-lysidine synthase